MRADARDELQIAWPLQIMWGRSVRVLVFWTQSLRCNLLRTTNQGHCRRIPARRAALPRRSFCGAWRRFGMHRRRCLPCAPSRTPGARQSAASEALAVSVRRVRMRMRTAAVRPLRMRTGVRYLRGRATGLRAQARRMPLLVAERAVCSTLPPRNGMHRRRLQRRGPRGISPAWMGAGILELPVAGKQDLCSPLMRA